MWRSRAPTARSPRSAHAGGGCERWWRAISHARTWGRGRRALGRGALVVRFARHLTPRWSQRCWVRTGGGLQRISLYDVDDRGRPKPARSAIRRSWARRRVLRPRVWAIFPLSGADLGALNIIELRSLSTLYRAHLRLIVLRAGHGWSPSSTSCRKATPPDPLNRDGCFASGAGRPADGRHAVLKARRSKREEGSCTRAVSLTTGQRRISAVCLGRTLTFFQGFCLRLCGRGRRIRNREFRGTEAAVRDVGADSQPPVVHSQRSVAVACRTTPTCSPSSALHVQHLTVWLPRSPRCHGAAASVAVVDATPPAWGARPVAPTQGLVGAGRLAQGASPGVVGMSTVSRPPRRPDDARRLKVPWRMS